MNELATGTGLKSKDNTRDASTISVSKLTQSFFIVQSASTPFSP